MSIILPFILFVLCFVHVVYDFFKECSYPSIASKNSNLGRNNKHYTSSDHLPHLEWEEGQDNQAWYGNP